MEQIKLHLVSHTHWDREWYLPFQVFRAKLVELIDALLDIMEKDPDYRFMLDGQTIVLEDYLEVRPENQAKLEQLIKNGRIRIGPWYVLPDEFLVSPEALIRNLLLGKKISEAFGARMMIGYIPDPFGHVGQMPQILTGFQIKDACFRRGLGDEPVELWWEANNGSRVLTSYLRDGYDNAAYVPLSSQKAFSEAINQIALSLVPHSSADDLLLLNGTDHQMPDGRISEMVRSFTSQEGQFSLQISDLPTYFQAAREKCKVKENDIPTISGELRKCKKHELLPGVLSARTWIKQRNHECEDLLERWAEPFSTIACWITKNESHNLTKTKSAPALIDLAWKYLLQCHPHDSICGCSIDQVHEEMRPRFDQVEQIAVKVTNDSLAQIVANIDTRSDIKENFLSLVVFNASPYPISGEIKAEFSISHEIKNVSLFDSKSSLLSSEMTILPPEILADRLLDQTEMDALLRMMADGTLFGLTILDCRLEEQDAIAKVEIVLGTNKGACSKKVNATIQDLKNNLRDVKGCQFHLLVRKELRAKLISYAKDVPPIGYKTYLLKFETPASPYQTITNGIENGIENQFIKATVEPSTGCIEIINKSTGKHFSNLVNFIDEGDAGDEYNFNPIPNDLAIAAKYRSHTIKRSAYKQQLIIDHQLDLPFQLSTDRSCRVDSTISHSIRTTLTLYEGGHRIDVRTEIENQARDHRLRVIFPTSLFATEFFTDSHFCIEKRELALPKDTETWVEQPRPEVPQRLFTFVQDGSNGFMLANKGLPEISAEVEKDGTVTLNLTLLRCVGWLSRNDLSVRPQAAGPILETPGAQQLGAHVFEYAIIPFGADWRDALPEAYGFSLPLKTITTDSQKGCLPAEQSFFDHDAREFLITAVKQDEMRTGVILRGCNLSNAPVATSFSTPLDISSIEQVNLDESSLNNRRKLNKKRFTISSEPYQIATTLLS